MCYKNQKAELHQGARAGEITPSQEDLERLLS